ncbi:MAG: Gfo/Idh/MocA family protein [Cetobacterium sp.]
MEKKRVGIIGCGVISGVHIPLIKKTNNLISVCDIDFEIAKKTGSENGCTYYRDYTEMLENEKLDTIHILTPHNIRYEIAELACEKGLHFIIEKPLAHTYEEAQKLIGLLERYPEIEATVVYQNRKNKSYVRLKDELKNCKSGEILGLEATVFWKRDLNYYESAPWRGKRKESGGGLLINQAIHTIDYIQDIGGEIKNISGQVFKLKNTNLDIEDTASIKFEFENGIEAFFSGTLCNFNNSSVTLKVYCQDGTYTIRNGELFLNKNDKEIILEKDEKGEIKDYYGFSHEREINDFYKSLGKRDKLYMPLEESLKSLEIITNVYKKGGLI